MITKQELDDMEAAINAAIKQTSLLTMVALTMQAQGNAEQAPMTVKELLQNNLIFASALKGIEKLRKEVEG